MTAAPVNTPAHLEPRGSDGALTSGSFLSQPGSFGYSYNLFNNVSRQLLATAKAVYRVDLRAGTVKPIFTLTNDDDLGGYADAQMGYDAGQTRISIITTRKTVCLFDSNGRTIFSVPYQPGYAEYPLLQVSFLQPTNGATANFAVWFRPDAEMNRKSGGKMPIHVLWLGPGQAVAKSMDLPPLPVVDFYPLAGQTGGGAAAAGGALDVGQEHFQPVECPQFCFRFPQRGCRRVAGAPPRIFTDGDRRLDALRLFAGNGRAAHSAVRAGMAGARVLSPLQKAPRR